MGHSPIIDLTVGPSILFEDATSRAGLNFTLRNGATGHDYQPEIMLGGVAALDYNNDGCMDIFFTNGAELPSGNKTGPEFHNRLYRNNCDRTFTDVTEAAGLAGEGYSMGVAAADYDNDGFTDIVVTGLNGNTLYHNRGNGTFENVTAKAGLAGTTMWSVSAGWFDYDNDGYLDLFITSYVEWKAGEDHCSEGGKPYYCHPRVYNPLPSRLYHNNHDGTFTDVSKSSGIADHLGKGMGVAFGDYNGDGFLDVFVTNDSVPNFLFQNLGNGKFRRSRWKRALRMRSMETRWRGWARISAISTTTAGRTLFWTPCILTNSRCIGISGLRISLRTSRFRRGWRWRLET